MLADGRRVTTGPDAEPDLFWALRGGGGNFGVVTSMRVRLHPVRDMLAGSVIYDWSEAKAVLRRYASFAATAPDELGVSVGMVSLQDGKPAVMVVPLWNGDRRRGERAMADVQGFGTPLSAQVGLATYPDVRMVWAHRDPFKSTASFLRLNYLSRAATGADIDVGATVANVLRQLK